jgi:ATP-dependent helicase/nuclease subunit B
MFADIAAPRVFVLPPGVDFAAQVAAGLRARLAGAQPQAIARVRLIVPTGRMRDAMTTAFLRHGPGYLPRITALSTLAGEDETPPLSRLLTLARLIRALLLAEPALGPPRAAFGLARSLAALTEEMADEGVPAQALTDLDVGDHAAHWQTSLRFLGIASPLLETTDGAARRLGAAVDALVQGWADAPPDGPVIVAGSTGSRGTTARLMQAVAGLAQGAVILPGYDGDLPDSAWSRLDDLRKAEDHPQARFRLFLSRLGLPHVHPWAPATAPDPARNRLISLALRPAPVTDQWRSDGALLGDPAAALSGVALIEAPGPRAEALAIARALAEAAAAGQSAALVTPDRTLARRVTAALDRWRIVPDDSAGRPLALSAPGRFLRQIAARVAGQTGAEGLIALLKHPLANSGPNRGPHLLALRGFERWLRDTGRPFPGPNDLAEFGRAQPPHAAWSGALGAWLGGLPEPGADLATGLPALRAAAEGLAAGPGRTGSGELWEEEAGRRALSRLTALELATRDAHDLTLFDLPALLDMAMAGDEVREPVAADPRVMIWGTLEARARSADLVILGGLTEGTWPAAPAPDPWLNRPLRMQAGLRLPERQIGLSAHDFQIAAAAPCVVLSRALRSTDAETVPSRWLNRLLNLTAGLPGGKDALAAARARGQVWLDRAMADQGDLTGVPLACATRNPRPAPAPPVSVRPDMLRVTQVATLIRDPYAIYARSVLRLDPLQPLAPEPDARLRGILLHKLFEEFVTRHPPGQPASARDFLDLARDLLLEELPWASERTMWLSRLARLAPAFLDWHAGLEGVPVLTETRGEWVLPGLKLRGIPDRIDRLPDGRLQLWDYKTGTLPTKAVQKSFDKQLILLALMAEDGVFPGVPPAEVAGAAYVGLGQVFDLCEAPVDRDTLDETRRRLLGLIARYRDPAQGYVARRALQKDTDNSDYDGLSRFGEWRVADPAVTLPVGDADG